MRVLLTVRIPCGAVSTAHAMITFWNNRSQSMMYEIPCSGGVKLHKHFGQ